MSPRDPTSPPTNASEPENNTDNRQNPSQSGPSRSPPPSGLQPDEANRRERHRDPRSNQHNGAPTSAGPEIHDESRDQNISWTQGSRSWAWNQTSENPTDNMNARGSHDFGSDFPGERRGSAYDFVPCHEGQCDHGTFSPRPESARSRVLSEASGSDRGFGGRFPAAQEDSSTGGGSTLRDTMGDAFTDGVLGQGNGKNMNTTQWLAKKHGVKNRRLMYLGYYIPFFTWIKQYNWSFFRGDLSAALTMASFYLPMALSYASNLGHIPSINGIYTFVFNPIIYAFLGSCPRMVVGPEAAGSLLVGTVVKDSVERGHIGEDDGDANSRVAGIVTGVSGAIIFLAGLSRLGFLDSVLSRPFLRGFISAIGFVIFVDQLIPEMGLSKVLAHERLSHGSSLEKVEFLFRHIKEAHGLTCAVSFISFGLIMLFRTLKNKLQPRFPSLAYIPDRFAIVVLSAILSWKLHWHEKGVDIMGHVRSSTGGTFTFRWPYQLGHMHHVREAMSTSFLIALLGFFESSVAAKSLGSGEGQGKEGIQGVTLSANRELIALGAANIVGGCFMALPGFGGYGRSKVNASTGGKTPMSSILLSLISLFCVLYLLPYFYYVPKGVLSAMISVVAYSLIEEAPHDIKFFWAIRGWSELALMAIIFWATMLYSLSLGIALGVGISLISVIKHSTRPRIQILGRVPGTDLYENAEENPGSLEFIEGCLIVKIPEPLTFANTGDLKNRLRRLELYGTTTAHPALPRVRAPEHNSNVIFDIHGVTGIDGSGTQVLAEIVQSYRDRGVRVFFCRVPNERSPVFVQLSRSGIVDSCGGHRHFVKSVEQALRLSELESLTEHFRDHPEEGV